MKSPPTCHTFFHVRFSPDSRYMLVSRSNKFRFRFRFDALVADETEDSLLGLDLSSFERLSIWVEILKKVNSSPLCVYRFRSNSWNDAKQCGTAAEYSLFPPVNVSPNFRLVLRK